jgi:hypothetical protein
VPKRNAAGSDSIANVLQRRWQINEKKLINVTGGDPGYFHLPRRSRKMTPPK